MASSRRPSRPATAAPGPLAEPFDGFASAVDRAALAALHEELTASPKPGLVTPADRGAHPDMDATTFFASLRSLRGVFGGAARLGAAGAPAWKLRRLGIEAEARMLEATGGVNTHRGAIFILGLLATAAGRLAAAGQRPVPGALRHLIRHALGPALLAELPTGSDSHGQAMAARHGADGARGEVAAGLPHLFEVALPAFQASLAGGAPRRLAAIQCLFTLIAVLPDTNLLWRGGAAGLALARSGAAEFLARGGVRRAGWEADAAALHRAFVAGRLSPGGSADLLAATLFVHRLAGPWPGGVGP